MTDNDEKDGYKNGTLVSNPWDIVILSTLLTGSSIINVDKSMRSVLSKKLISLRWSSYNFSIKGNVKLKPT